MVKFLMRAYRNFRLLMAALLAALLAAMIHLFFHDFGLAFAPFISFLLSVQLLLLLFTRLTPTASFF